MSSGTNRDARHKAAMQKQKSRVDASIAAASEERGVALLLTGDGKGKSSSAFGMVMRALGYGQKVGVVQFIKGEQLSGEEIYLRDHCPRIRLVLGKERGRPARRSDRYHRNGDAYDAGHDLRSTIRIGRSVLHLCLARDWLGAVLGHQIDGPSWFSRLRRVGRSE